MKREASAIAELNRALELDPQYPEAAESLAYLYAATARPERAVEAFRTALALSPHKATTHFNLGFVYHEQKQYDAAVAAFENAVEIDPISIAPGTAWDSRTDR